MDESDKTLKEKAMINLCSVSNMEIKEEIGSKTLDYDQILSKLTVHDRIVRNKGIVTRKLLSETSKKVKLY